MDDEVVINRALLKAIGAESRISILKLLANGRKTQSQLAESLGLSSPTVLEHLAHLESAGLLEKVDEGRKWKYYELTAIGRKLAAPKPGFPTRAILLLAFGLVFMAFSGMSILYPAPSPEQLLSPAAAGIAPDENGTMVLTARAEAQNPSAAEEANATAVPAAATQEPSPMLLYGALVLGAAMFLYGAYEALRRMEK
jgi:DNA-binding transcriptional ArsR family regulator